MRYVSMVFWLLVSSIALGASPELPVNRVDTRADVPPGATEVPGAYCQAPAVVDLHAYLQQLAAAFARGETVLSVQLGNDLEHSNRFVACKRIL